MREAPERETELPSSQPTPDTRLVVPVGVAEAPLEIPLFASHDAVAQDDEERQREDEDPRAAGSDADAGIEKKHADVDRIAAPAVDAGGDQRAHRLIGRHRR